MGWGGEVNPRFLKWLRSLIGMIVTLMALGAYVRTMKAGLACPDWPLCFGKVIPDFHFGVWLEFIHRVDAALVALVFFGCCLYALRAKAVPRATRRAAVVGLVLLLVQILMGGLTVLWLVRHVVVTTHLMLATFFLCSVLWMINTVDPRIEFPERPVMKTPFGFRLAVVILPLAILFQIFLGGLVASTYSGSVCVDWPLCNGQWVPTWQGAIGLQVMHRFLAYALAAGILVLWLVLRSNSRRNQPWATKQLVRLSRLGVLVVFAQLVVGVANLLLYIPPALTVVHQSVAMILLGVSLRLFFVARAIATEKKERSERTPERTSERPSKKVVDGLPGGTLKASSECRAEPRAPLV